jgi:hypothetical protein
MLVASIDISIKMFQAPPDRHEIFANFVVDWNVHGDKWQSPHWREKIAPSAKLQLFFHCRCLHGFCRCRRL